MIRRRLATNLLAYRQIFNLSQKQLALLSGVSKANIGNIENMRISASIDLIYQLSIALKIDICMLLARSAIRFPGTGIGKIKLVPVLLSEAEASFAFWTKENGMEYHLIDNSKLNNAICMMALLQANGITGKDLLDKSKKLHIPYKL